MNALSGRGVFLFSFWFKTTTIKPTNLITRFLPLKLGSKKCHVRFSSHETRKKAQNSFVSFRLERRLRQIGFYCVVLPYSILSLIPTYFLVNGIYFYGKSYMLTQKKTEIDYKQKYSCIANGYFFYAVTGYASLPLSMVLFLCYPYDYFFDPYERKLMSKIQILWAQITCFPFFKPTIFFEDESNRNSLENIICTGRSSINPTKGVVFVSNHLSWCDIYILLCAGLPIKFVAKSEIFMIPLVGWVMHLIGHIKLKRGNKLSGKNVLSKCSNALKKGVAVFFFPEGTRNKKTVSSESDIPFTCELLPFKRGAFVAAMEAETSILPIIISGSNLLMPCSKENFFYLDVSKSVSVHVMREYLPTNIENDRIELRQKMQLQFDNVLANSDFNNHRNTVFN